MQISTNSGLLAAWGRKTKREIVAWSGLCRLRPLPFYDCAARGGVRRDDDCALLRFLNEIWTICRARAVMVLGKYTYEARVILSLTLQKTELLMKTNYPTDII